ncbi:acyltransferase family protein [Vibrio scophthalmi]|uniref:Acyltransferase 3 domain-containing protein n=1 Tax=Vibrio scophthalmi TaxID=45658 RepID=A0A1C7FFT1_9VIBR|nr:acyltransferase [Vibrio scophthalmi]ANU38618.1 hypothetical protein VSVS05_03581 [Vibrio scophthalmi]
MIKRFESLDAFRGIAALMVAIFHLNVVGGVSNLAIVKNSPLFVEFFFVLSGFVISYSYGNRISNFSEFADFSIKRFARIWPLHIFMLVLFIPFALANITFGLDLGERFSLYSFISSFFLVQSLTINGESWNIVAWSISSEFYTYILFGALSLIPFFKEKAIIPLCIAVVSMLLMNIDMDTNKLILRCFASFFLGCLAFRCYLNVVIKPWMEITSIIIVITTMSLLDRQILYVLMPPLFFIVVIIFSHESGPLSKVLKIKPLQTLGVLSYSIYLSHAWFITTLKSFSIIIDKFFGYSFMRMIEGERFIDFGSSLNDLIFVPFLTIVIIFSYFTHKYIELKFQKKILNTYFSKTQAYAN